MSQDHNFIEIFGAREHNLKNVSVKIPKYKLVVVTGLSGSGKSSLVFDTICAEGQRRYIETFSTYARNFLGDLQRPDVDKINGLSPVISIEQKTTSKNPRSTVGTITEIYDFLRLLFAKISVAYSPETGKPMIQYSQADLVNIIIQRFITRKIIILAPLIRSRKGNYRELFQKLQKKGFLEVRLDQKLKEITDQMTADRYKAHDIEVVIDKLLLSDPISESNVSRLKSSIQYALNTSDGSMMILDVESQKEHFFSKNLMCSSSGVSYQPPEPNTFSFNSPKGCCPVCKGLGVVEIINLDSLIPNKRISYEQQFIPIIDELEHKKWIKNQIGLILKKNKESQTTAWENLKPQTQNEILNGSSEKFTIDLDYAKIKRSYNVSFEGLIEHLKRLREGKSEVGSKRKNLLSDLFQTQVCNCCLGKRLKKESLNFKIDNKSISEISDFSLSSLYNWIKILPEHLSEKQNKIAFEILDEITKRLEFLIEVGLDYLSLSRSSKSLSGGEFQRIRLATQIGSQLENVLYVFDEPSIGLHARDNSKLIDSLKKLRDLGNSVLVVEHDKEMILNADYVIDMGPKAGQNGGEVIWQGSPKDISSAKTITADYLNGKLKIQSGNRKISKTKTKYLRLNGCTGNNLKNVDLQLPLGVLTCITGVSGSGKSSLISNTLYPILNQYFYRAKTIALGYKEIIGLEFLDKIVDVDQSPIGRTPRSSPATYTGVYTDIRNLFAMIPESKIRGYKSGRFSFNVKGGRCETCLGSGLRLIEMNFLPDIYVECETCNGKRFNRETLEIRYKGKSIADILEMSVDQSADFFFSNSKYTS